LLDIDAAQDNFLCAIRGRSLPGADREIPQQQPNTAIGCHRGSKKSKF
jgi:hypothetical protein